MRSRLPPRGSTLLVQNCKDLYALLLVEKVDGVWETTHENAPHLSENETIAKWSFRCSFYCCIELQDELDT